MLTKITRSFLSKLILACAVLGLSACDSSKQERSSNTEAAKIYVQLGLSYLDDGQVARAKQKLNHALELAPKMPGTHTAMAAFWERTGQIDAAQDEYVAAIDLDPHNGRLLNNYGVFLCRQERYEQAHEKFNKAMQDRNYANLANVYENAATCLVQQAKYKQAKQYFERAVLSDPKLALSHLELTKIYISEGNYLQARESIGNYHQLRSPTKESVEIAIIVANNLQDRKMQQKYNALLD